MPHTDLLVSPDHAIFVDGKLICARQLINGTTIRQEKGWTVGRVFPRRAGRARHPARRGPAGGELPRHRQPRLLRQLGRAAGAASRPDRRDRLPDARGGLLRAVRVGRGQRAAGMAAPGRACRRARPAGAGSRDHHRPGAAPRRQRAARIKPIYGDDGLFIFAAAAQRASEVRLVSRASAPTEARPWLDDRRRLGVRVERIVLRDADEVREIPVDHPDLAAGLVGGRAGRAPR